MMGMPCIIRYTNVKVVASFYVFAHLHFIDWLLRAIANETMVIISRERMSLHGARLHFTFDTSTRLPRFKRMHPHRFQTPAFTPLSPLPRCHRPSTDRTYRAQLSKAITETITSAPQVSVSIPPLEKRTSLRSLVRFLRWGAENDANAAPVLWETEASYHSISARNSLNGQGRNSLTGQSQGRSSLTGQGRNSANGGILPPRSLSPRLQDATVTVHQELIRMGIGSASDGSPSLLMLNIAPVHDLDPRFTRVRTFDDLSHSRTRYTQLPHTTLESDREGRDSDFLAPLRDDLVVNRTATAAAPVPTSRLQMAAKGSAPREGRGGYKPSRSTTSGKAGQRGSSIAGATSAPISTMFQGARAETDSKEGAYRRARSLGRPGGFLCCLSAPIATHDSDVEAFLGPGFL